MNVKEPIKSFEQARSIQICELELFGRWGRWYLFCVQEMSLIFHGCNLLPTLFHLSRTYLLDRRIHYSTPATWASCGQNFRGVQVRWVTRSDAVVPSYWLIWGTDPGRTCGWVESDDKIQYTSGPGLPAGLLDSHSSRLLPNQRRFLPHTQWCSCWLQISACLQQ